MPSVGVILEYRWTAMKKILTPVFAIALLLFSVVANAGQITASNVFGHPGDTVRLDVSLSDGDISYGGDFTIGFDSTRLTLVNVIGRSDSTYDFSTLFYFDPVVYVPSALFPAVAPIDSFFSIFFSINSSYPATIFPDETPVDISGYFYDVNSQEVPLDRSIAPIVTVLARNGGTLPEPGALALVALALLAMAAVTLRGRTNRG